MFELSLVPGLIQNVHHLIGIDGRFPQHSNIDYDFLICELRHSHPRLHVAIRLYFRLDAKRCAMGFNSCFGKQVRIHAHDSYDLIHIDDS